MEWCEEIYVEWKSAEVLRRLERTVAVLLLLMLAVAGVEYGNERIQGLPGEGAVEREEKAAETALSGKEPIVSESILSGIYGADEILSADIKSAFEGIPGKSADIPGNAAGEVSGAAVVPGADSIPGGAEVSVSEIAIPETAAPVLPEDGKETLVPEEEFPPESLPGEGMSESGPKNVNGFLVDTSGMICGIAHADVISDGYVILPSEECSGIRATAFADISELITEIYIPSEITRIEEGAFACLRSLEWLEAEGSDVCFTEDGVLFSENGTCILGFPSARTGAYKVPQRVTRFAEDAFATAQIEILDAVGCSLSDTGNLPSSIRLLLSGDLAG